MNSFTLFNLSEGIFWLGLGILSIFLGHLFGKKYHKISLAAGIIFGLFGISDFVEIGTGGFVGTHGWLLWWKIVNTVLVFALTLQYLKLRLK